jgi:hypothetical protein
MSVAPTLRQVVGIVAAARFDIDKGHQTIKQ